MVTVRNKRIVIDTWIRSGIPIIFSIHFIDALRQDRNPTLEAVYSPKHKVKLTANDATVTVYIIYNTVVSAT